MGLYLGPLRLYPCVWGPRSSKEIRAILGLVAQWCPFPFFLGSRFPYKVTNPKKGALTIRWLLGDEVRAVVGVH